MSSPSNYTLLPCEDGMLLDYLHQNCFIVQTGQELNDVPTAPPIEASEDMLEAVKNHDSNFSYQSFQRPVSINVRGARTWIWNEFLAASQRC